MRQSRQLTSAARVAATAGRRAALRAMVCAVAGVSMLCAGTAGAAAWPTKPVTMVVPYPAGGATDVVARSIAEKLTQNWGQTVVVENRAGAGTTIGAASVARAAGDGQTLFMTTSAHTISTHLYKGLSYDPVKDFAPITLVTKVPLVLVVNPDIPAKNLQAFLAYLKKDGAQVNFASPGNGTAQHLSGERFKIATKANLTHVPYRGDAPAITDLAGGQVQMMLATITAVLPMIESGRLRALAVANDKRVAALKDVPTFEEAGMPDFQAATWFGLLAPAAIEPARVQQIRADVARIVDTPEMRQRIEGLGGEVVNSTPEQFATFMAAETTRWGEAVKASGTVAQ